MSDKDYFEVESFYIPRGESPDLIQKGEDSEDGEWTYFFYWEESDIPKYLKEHAERRNSASDIDETQKIGRMTEEHLEEDAIDNFDELGF
ncbi:MAG: hypothetical protein V5A72_03060 [Candidatus Nanohaloarchaea archaeon]